MLLFSLACCKWQVFTSGLAQQWRFSFGAWHCWFGHLACKIVPEMTYYVSSGTLNPTHSLTQRWRPWKKQDLAHCWASSQRKIAYSISHSITVTHSASLFEASGTKAFILAWRMIRLQAKYYAATATKTTTTTATTTTTTTTTTTVPFNGRWSTHKLSFVFCFCDLDLAPVILIYELNLDILKMYSWGWYRTWNICTAQRKRMIPQLTLKRIGCLLHPALTSSHKYDWWHLARPILWWCSITSPKLSLPTSVTCWHDINSKMPFKYL